LAYLQGMNVLKRPETAEALRCAANDGTHVINIVERCLQSLLAHESLRRHQLAHIQRLDAQLRKAA
jgi:hypothetical protein